MIFFWEIEN